MPTGPELDLDAMVSGVDRRCRRAPSSATTQPPMPLVAADSPPTKVRVMSAEGDREPLAEGTLISHLIELRQRLLKAVIAVFVCFIPCAIFSDKLFTLVAMPLIEKMPEGTSMIATSLVSPFMAPLKLALFVALFIAMPYVLYQAWAFVAPGPVQAREAFRDPAGRLEHPAVLRAASRSRISSCFR